MNAAAATLADADALLFERCTALQARVQAAFEAVHATRMAGVPILNPALRVHALGFAPCAQGCLGALVTPWFINLVLLPLRAEERALLAPGATGAVALPAGSFDFVGASDDALGEWCSCSLFSPVLEFADHDTAVMTALTALRMVREAPARPQDGSHAGAECLAADAPGRPEAGAAEAPSASDAQAVPARRRFLGGIRLARDGSC